MCRETSQTDCSYHDLIHARLCIGMINFRALDGNTVSETPTIGNYDVVGSCRLSAKSRGRSCLRARHMMIFSLVFVVFVPRLLIP